MRGRTPRRGVVLITPGFSLGRLIYSGLRPVSGAMGEWLLGYREVAYLQHANICWVSWPQAKAVGF